MDDSSFPSETPATIAYAELVQDHLERIFKATFLILGDRDEAENQTLAAFERIWSDLNEGNVFGDATEILYRAAVRGSLGRLRRSRELRGYLPPTTADDRLITAMGIIGDFEPQQRAAILLSIVCGTGYDLAGIATGIGAARARDLAFAARQEYRNARGAAPDATALCAEVAPLLSQRADDDLSSSEREKLSSHLATCRVCQETEAIYDEFMRLLVGMRLPQLADSFAEEVRQVPFARRNARPEGWRRVLRLVMGPAILVAILIAGLFVLQGFGFGPNEPTIRTGTGRTSDILYAWESGNGSLEIIESGSGRRLGRVAATALSADGSRAYGGAATCRGSECTTTISVVDTGTLESTSEVGRVPGRLRVIGVDSANRRLVLADEQAGWGRLTIYDLASNQLRDSVSGPTGVERPFDPAQARMSADGQWLTTIGSAGGQIAVVLTDVSGLRVVGTVLVDAPVEGGIEALAPDAGGRVLAYENGTGRLHELDPSAGRVLRTIDLSGRAAADNAPPGGERPVGTVADDGKGAVYAVVRTGGIAVVDRARLEVLRRLNADRDYATVAAGSGGRQIYAVDRANVYLVLDASTGNQLLRRPDVQAAGLLQVNRGE